MGAKVMNNDTGTEGPINKKYSPSSPEPEGINSGKPIVDDTQNPENVNAVINISSRRIIVTGGNQLQLHGEQPQ